MSTQFNEITISNLPFVQAEISKKISVTGLATQPFTSLIIGQKVASAGTVASNAVYSIFSRNEAVLKFGENSMLSRAVDGYFDNNVGVELKVLPLDDLAGGTQATGSLTVSGTATGAGTFSFYIDGRVYRVAVSVGDSATDITTAISLIINADSSSLVTSSFVLGVLTITSVHKGTFGNSLKMMMNYNSDEITPSGFSTVIVPLSGGAGDPDLTTFVIPHLEETQYNLIACAYNDNANLILLRQALADNFLATQMQDSFLMTSVSDTVSNLVIKAEAINSGFITLLDDYSAFMNGLEFASRNLGYIADIAQNNPGLGYLNSEVKGVLALTQRIRDERNVLAGKGISTFKVNGTRVINEKTVTSYIKDAQGIEDDSFKELRVLLTLSYIRYSFVVKMAQFQNFKLGNDDDIFGAGVRVMTPKLYAENATFVYEDLVKAAICEDMAGFQASLLTEKLGNRINSEFNVNIINVLEQQAMKINFEL